MLSIVLRVVTTICKGSKYKRTTTRQSWDENPVKQAVMTPGAMGPVKASDQFGVPQAALERGVQRV